MFVEGRVWILYPLKRLNSKVGQCDIVQGGIYRKIPSATKYTLHGRFVVIGVSPSSIAASTLEQGNLTEAAVLGIASSWQAGSTEASNDDWSSDYMWTIYLSNRI